MKEDYFYIESALLSLKRNRIVDFSKIPRRFWRFLQSLGEIKGIQTHQYEKFTFIFCPPDNHKGEENLYIMMIYGEWYLTEKGKKEFNKRNSEKWKKYNQGR